jgi:hypothetical protein
MPPHNKTKRQGDPVFTLAHPASAIARCRSHPCRISKDSRSSARVNETAHLLRRSSTTSTGGWSASSSRTPTTRNDPLRPNGISSPGRQFGTALDSVGGPVGAPPSTVSSLNRKPAIRSPLPPGAGRLGESNQSPALFEVTEGCWRPIRERRSFSLRGVARRGVHLLALRARTRRLRCRASAPQLRAAFRVAVWTPVRGVPGATARVRVQRQCLAVIHRLTPGDEPRLQELCSRFKDRVPSDEEASSLLAHEDIYVWVAEVDAELAGLRPCLCSVPHRRRHQRLPLRTRGRRAVPSPRTWARTG